jgi:glycosyltransferase involved in cell wall biosynthesis
VVTHLPNTDGYHAGRLEVVQTCLTTMRRGARLGHTLMVWDNGSCEALRDWLREEFQPDTLILSANVGKTAARTSMIRMLPTGSVIAYSDDDMLYYDNWLIPQIALLQHFPNVAAVSGYPVRTSFRWGNTNTKAWASRTHGAKLEYGRFIPKEWEDDFAVSLGRTPAWHADYTRNDNDARITYKGVTAYATAHHCQFIGYQDRLARVARYDGQAMGDEKVLDIALDDIGLRLATTDRHCRHIGNVLDDDIRREITRTYAYTVPANAR